LKDEIGVSIVEGEKAKLVDDEKSNLGVVVQATIERTSRLLSAEVEKELGRGEEERGASGKDGSMSEILGDHGLAQPSRDRHASISNRLSSWRPFEIERELLVSAK
jgi:hypothetical protein